MEKIKILLLVSSRFGLPSMRDMVQSQTLGLVGIPAHCEEIIQEVTMLLAPYGIPILVLQKGDFVTTLQTAIEQHEINLGFVLSFSFKIPSVIYEHKNLKGFFNVHNGVLPEYRGPDPVFQQIKLMEKFPGVTIHKLVDQMDAGDIVLQEKILANFNDTYGLLFDKLAELASKLTGTIIKMIFLDIKIPSKPQNESKAKYYKKQDASQVSINWQTMDTKTIVALVNACNPWNKGAVTRLNHKLVRILKASIYHDQNLTFKNYKPGQIIFFKGNEMVVSTINNEFLTIELIYIDEGFFHASILSSLGFFIGQQFSEIN